MLSLTLHLNKRFDYITQHFTIETIVITNSDEFLMREKHFRPGFLHNFNTILWSLSYSNVKNIYKILQHRKRFPFRSSVLTFRFDDFLKVRLNRMPTPPASPYVYVICCCCCCCSAPENKRDIFTLAGALAIIDANTAMHDLGMGRSIGHAVPIHISFSPIKRWSKHIWNTEKVRKHVCVAFICRTKRKTTQIEWFIAP